MEFLKTSFFNPIFPPPPSNRSNLSTRCPSKSRKPQIFIIHSSVTPDPWSLSDGNPARPKPRSKNAKKPLSDDNARRIIKAKAQYLSLLRRNQGPSAQTPKWIKRTPEQMVQYLEDNRNGHLYGKHVVAAIRHVRSLSQKAEGEYDMRMEMASFVGKLNFREMCIVLKEQKGWRQARDVFDWMKLQLSYRPSVIVYTIVLRTYGQVGKIKLAEETFLEMLEVGLQPDEVACGTMLCTYARWGHHKAMLSFYSAVKDRGIIPSIAVFNFMLSSLQKKRLHAKVKELWMLMVEIGDAFKAGTLTKELLKLDCQLDDATIASLISLYGKEKKINQAAEIFAAVADFSTSKLIFGSMIDAYTKCDKAEEAFTLYKDLMEKGNDLGAVAVSRIMNTLTVGGKHQVAENVIRTSLKCGLELDTVAFNTFIKAMLEAGKLHFASKIYERMIALGIVPSIQTYNTMISVYGRGRKLDKAVEMFNAARSSGVSPDEKAYTNLISCYGKAGKIHEASLLFKEMLEEGIKPGMVSYNIMINVYATAGLHDETEKLFKAMEQDGFLPDSFTYFSLIRAYTQSCKYSEAEGIINSMKEKGIPTSCAHFDLLLSALAKAGMIRKAERVYDELQTAGLNPDVTCNRTLMRGYLDYGYVKEGIKFFESTCKYTGDRFIMSAAVHFYKIEKEEDAAFNILDSMKSLGISFLKDLQVGSKLGKLESAGA